MQRGPAITRERSSTRTTASGGRVEPSVVMALHGIVARTTPHEEDITVARRSSLGATISPPLSGCDACRDTGEARVSRLGLFAARRGARHDAPRGRRRLVATALAILVLGAAGCARTIGFEKIDRESLLSLAREPDIRAVHYPAPSFRVIGARDAAVRVTEVLARLTAGLLSPLVDEARLSAEESEGERIATDAGLEDPTPVVKERLVSRMARELGFANLRLHRESLADVRVDPDPLSRDVNPLRGLFQGGLVLEVLTLHWGVGSWISYSARARLVRLNDSRILWRGQCVVRIDPAPPRQRLLAERGRLLRASYTKLAEACAERLWDELRSPDTEPAGPLRTEPPSE